MGGVQRASSHSGAPRAQAFTWDTLMELLSAKPDNGEEAQWKPTTLATGPDVQVDNPWSEENLLEPFNASGSSQCI